MCCFSEIEIKPLLLRVLIFVGVELAVLILWLIYLILAPALGRGNRRLIGSVLCVDSSEALDLVVELRVVVEVS